MFIFSKHQQQKNPLYKEQICETYKKKHTHTQTQIKNIYKFESHCYFSKKSNIFPLKNKIYCHADNIYLMIKKSA